MGRWSTWKKLASGDDWWTWDEHNGQPACYELGIGGPRSCTNPEVVYVGETGNLLQRLTVHATHQRDNLRADIDHILRRGRGVYFRAAYFSTKAAAKRRQNDLLGEFDYDWNIQRNT